MDAQSAFAEIIENLPRQHLRTRFRNHFGLASAGFDKDTFARGTVRVPLDRSLSRLLQEEPQKLTAVLLSGPIGELGVTRTSPKPADTLDSLISADRVLLVHGTTARLYAYLASGDDEVWVRRVAVPREGRPDAKPKAPVLSRRERAALAGKTKTVKRPINRRRR